MRETEVEGGYPVFTLVSIHATPAGRVKTLIFASPLRPDIRFRNAVSNNIEIVSNVEDVLVYDRAIGTSGLRWSDLQTWWSELRSPEREHLRFIPGGYGWGVSHDRKPDY